MHIDKSYKFAQAVKIRKILLFISSLNFSEFGRFGYFFLSNCF